MSALSGSGQIHAPAVRHWKKNDLYRLNTSVDGTQSWAGSVRLNGNVLHRIYIPGGMGNLLVSKLSAVPACPSGKDT